MRRHTPEFLKRAGSAASLALLFLLAIAPAVRAHPLGNFTVNQFARLEVGSDLLKVRYVVDMAEIAAFQELQRADADRDGQTSAAELDDYANQAADHYAVGLVITVDGRRTSLRLDRRELSRPPGAGNLATLRFEADYSASAPAAGAAPTLVTFENNNHTDRIGWRELVVTPAQSAAVFDSTAFGSPATDELRAYPEDTLAAPLDERSATFSYAAGPVPSGSTALLTRDGRLAGAGRDRLSELIAVNELTLPVALLGLFLAAALGGFHALSPGHGKTVVGAYLVGSRGTARHAAFLGLTVTITHTAGVFALGFITLFASQYILPEQLFPVLAVISGAIVVAIGGKLLASRVREAFGSDVAGHGEPGHHSHHHRDDHRHEEGDQRDPAGHTHTHGGAGMHSHGGRVHSHLPPGTGGTRVTWRSLLALGVSGGLLPCPSALVVLLSAISLNRVGYGMLLIVAFSVGLAGVLTAIGLLFVYAGRYLKSSVADSRIVRLLPVGSALVITCIGMVICYDAVVQAGWIASAHSAAAVVGTGAPGADAETSLVGLGMLGALGLGLGLGLKHAMEADHVVAVSTIVSESRSLKRAAVVGGLWGIGHTLSLVVVGAFVLALRVTIPDPVAHWLEFCVALMIIILGASALGRALRGRADVHRHTHGHEEEGLAHSHVHFHETRAENAGEVDSHSHRVVKIGLKPVFVGAIHGLAGSAALTILVLSQISSVGLGLLYLAVFGIGSIGGMIVMSGLVGLPFALSFGRTAAFHRGLQVAAGVLSIVFGVWYAYGILAEAPAAATVLR